MSARDEDEFQVAPEPFRENSEGCVSNRSLHFVLAIGTAGGLLQSLIALAKPRDASALGAGVVFFGAAALACWLGVRRRRHRVWSIAVQLTAASTLADLVALAIALAVTVPGLNQLPWRDAVINAGSAQLGLLLIRFPVALGLVLAGRGFSRIGPDSPSRQAPDVREHRDAVT